MPKTLYARMKIRVSPHFAGIFLSLTTTPNEFGHFHEKNVSIHNLVTH